MSAVPKTDIAVPTVPLLINGEWVDSSATEFRNVVNPATQEVLARVPLATASEVAAAVGAAHRAFATWRHTPIARGCASCCASRH